MLFRFALRLCERATVIVTAKSPQPRTRRERPGPDHCADQSQCAGAALVRRRLSHDQADEGPVSSGL